jgi:hypothetical protein
LRDTGIERAILTEPRPSRKSIEHPDPNQEHFFFGLLRECLDAGVIDKAIVEEEIARKHVRRDALTLVESAG